MFVTGAATSAAIAGPATARKESVNVIFFMIGSPFVSIGSLSSTILSSVQQYYRVLGEPRPGFRATTKFWLGSRRLGATGSRIGQASHPAFVAKATAALPCFMAENEASAPRADRSSEFTMPAPNPPAFETLSLHAGQHPDPVTGARAVPIYQTTSYVFQDSEHAAALFNLERAGHIYTRISNPTTAVLEERLAALENGVGAICTASGQAAMHLAIATLLNAGEHIVASSSLYGGTINLLAHTLPRFGITTTFVKPRDLAAFRASIRPNTRLVIAETIGNPGLEVLDIPAVAAIAHDAKIPLLIDNTFATPYLSRPIDLGADIVMHSITKWIGGHAVAIGGAIIDGGCFDWRASGKFAVLTEPYAGYHGMVFDEQFGPSAFIMRARTEGLRDFGACMSPTNAFQLLQGIETLPVRME